MSSVKYVRFEDEKNVPDNFYDKFFEKFNEKWADEKNVFFYRKNRAFCCYFVIKYLIEEKRWQEAKTLFKLSKERNVWALSNKKSPREIYIDNICRKYFKKTEAVLKNKKG